MKVRPVCVVVLMTVFLFPVAFSVFAQSSNPQHTLNQYVADLQKNPNDYALREKIIRHVQGMKPAPAVPEEAKRHLVRGKAAFKGAKEARDFQDAADEFKKALLYAPWLAEGYYNLGVIQDKAGQYDDAMKNLRFYLIAAPRAPDAEKVRELVYEIEYRKEKAAKEPSRQTAAVPKQSAFEDLLRKIDGRRYYYPIPGQNGYANTLDVSGQYLLLGLVVPPGHKGRNDPGGFISYANRADGRYEIRGRETTVRIPYHTPPQQYTQEWAVEVTYIISESGDRITERNLFNTGRVGNELIYVWRQGLSQ